MKEKMTVSMKLAMAVLMIMVFAFMSADEASAAKKPKWVKVSVAKWSIEKNPDQKNSDKAGYWMLKVTLKHVNNSKDQVITTFYDKSGTMTLSGMVDYGNDPLKVVCKAKVNSSKVNRVSVDPGSSYNLSYNLPITNFDCSSKGFNNWKDANMLLGKRMKGWKLDAGYDVAVKSEGI